MAIIGQEDGAIIQKPRYLQLAEELRKAILSGAMQADDGFPTENALCKTYGVSRFTVREALRRLQIEGLIARRRGSGTVIQPPRARDEMPNQPLLSVGEILHYSRDSGIRFAAQGSAALPLNVARQFPGVGRGAWFHFRGIRIGEGETAPIAVIDAYVTTRLADVVAKIDPARSTIFRQIEDHAGIEVSRVIQDIQALPASTDIARALGIARRSPCLRVLRRYFDGDGRVFELSISHHPGNRFSYSMDVDMHR